MNEEQYATMLRLFADFGGQIQTLRQDMNDGFAKVYAVMDYRFDEARKETKRQFDEMHLEMDCRFNEVNHKFEAIDRRFDEVYAKMDYGFDEVYIKMNQGFAQQQAISMEIMNAMSDPFVELENDVRKTKRAHNKRFLTIERHVGLV